MEYCVNKSGMDKWMDRQTNKGKPTKHKATISQWTDTNGMAHKWLTN